MAATRHVYSIYVKASVEAVWNALLDPEFTRRYFFGTAYDASPVEGESYSTSTSDGTPAVEGTIEALEPCRRLVQTWRVLYDAVIKEEQPSRVEWTLSQAGEGLTRVDLVHGDLAFSPLTWAHVKDGWVYVLDGLKSVLETGEGLPPLASDPPPIPDPVAQWHRQQAVEANNSVWEILVGEDRSADALEEMTRRAYASAYHWARAAGTGPANEARGEWMLSRVWTVRGNAELGLAHAERCLAACREHGLMDFDLAYGHEARARALACAGRLEEAAEERRAASAVPIADPEDEAILVSDIESGPWFALAD